MCVQSQQFGLWRDNEEIGVPKTMLPADLSCLVKMQGDSRDHVSEIERAQLLTMIERLTPSDTHLLAEIVNRLLRLS